VSYFEGKTLGPLQGASVGYNHNNGACELSLGGSVVANLAIVTNGSLVAPVPIPGGWGTVSSPVHTVTRPNGSYYTFQEVSPGIYNEASGYRVRLELDGNQWKFYDLDNTIDVFEEGRLLSRTFLGGRVLTMAYDPISGRLSSVTDGNGNSLQFTYGPRGQLDSLSHPGGLISYGYGPNYGDGLDNNLLTVTYENAAVREYHYENETFPNHLTGITDERGIRYATWAYDAEGRAVSSSHAGNVDLVTLDYYSTYTEVTDASGGVRQYQLGNVGARQAVTGVTGDKCIDCPRNGMKLRTYDSNGYLDEVTDWEGNVTDYDYDARGLEVQRIEGKGTAQSRTISTVWHSVFRVPTQITESDRIVNFTYSSTGAQLSRQVLPNPGPP
jgi:YD repeat-containing protein